MIKNILIIFLVTLVIILYIDSTKMNEAEKSNNESSKSFSNDLNELEKIRSISKKPSNNIKKIGWIPDWDFEDSFKEIKNSNIKYDTLSPVWFLLNENGSLKKNEFTNNSDFIKYTSKNKIELIPTITQLDPLTLNEILKSEENYKRHVEAIIGQALDNDYDGIDLDYEAIYLKDKDKYFDLLEDLSKGLKLNDKKLVVTVLPKWGDEVIYKTLPETRAVQDYNRINIFVDEIRIMAYEYTGRSAEAYGPISPIDWIEDIIRYSLLSGVPREKLVIGVNTYSYNYTERPEMESINYYPVYEPRSTKNLEDALAHFLQTLKVY
ncbi:MAG: glycosyl hydrolase family 18 protein [Candidatus Dojkabacteria bacterium]|nr:glycosyl hydrolase family 18 protein [Candidatus Dojkabacteria bacterium]